MSVLTSASPVDENSFEEMEKVRAMSDVKVLNLWKVIVAIDIYFSGFCHRCGTSMMYACVERFAFPWFLSLRSSILDCDFVMRSEIYECGEILLCSGHPSTQYHFQCGTHNYSCPFADVL